MKMISALMVGGPHNGEIRQASGLQFVYRHLAQDGTMRNIRYEIAKAMIPVSETEGMAFRLFRFMRPDGELEGFEGHEEAVMKFAKEHGEPIDLLPVEKVNRSV